MLVARPSDSNRGLLRLPRLRERSRSRGRRFSASDGGGRRVVNLNTRHFFLSLCAVGGLSSVAAGQPAVETMSASLVVCAQEQALPFSHRDERGFENKIVNVLASDMGVQLEYRWMNDVEAARALTLLQRGECDLLMAVADGQEGLASTTAYYMSHYVFVKKASANFAVTSLDDPVLGDLKIGIQLTAAGGGGPPLDSLAKRRLVPNVRRFEANYRRDSPFDDVLDAVLSGEVDLAIVWGPTAGNFAERHAGLLTIEPVTPLIDAPFLPFFAAISMGARVGDQALVDDLNAAIANRWDEIQAILRDAGVPVDESARPSTRVAEDAVPRASEVRVGLIVPLISSRSTLDGTYYTQDLLGESARRGAVLAEAELSQVAEGEPQLMGRLFLAAAPDLSTSERAVQRLLALDDVDVIIGGIVSDQADLLTRVADEQSRVFFSLAQRQPEEIERCPSNTFYLDASAEMYLRAIVNVYASAELTRWFVLHDSSPDGRVLAAAARASLADQGITDFTSGEVEPGALSYREALLAIEQAGADTVLSLLQPGDFGVFLSQQGIEARDLRILEFPYAEIQSLERLSNEMDRTGNANWATQLVLWHEEETGEGASATLAGRYASRWGRAMDPMAWASYTAYALAVNGTRELGAFDTAAFVRLLQGADASHILTLGNGDVVDGGHPTLEMVGNQVRRPLFVLRLNYDAQWGRKPSEQLKVAEVVGEWVPSVQPVCPTR